MEHTRTIPLLKNSDELHTVTGLVLIPDLVDAHGDVCDAETIRDAAYDFLAKYNATTELGLQHVHFGKDIALVESFIAPVTYELPGGTVPVGAWVMTVQILDLDMWTDIKDGIITGFSIGATATVAVEAPDA